MISVVFLVMSFLAMAPGERRDYCSTAHNDTEADCNREFTEPSGLASPD
jgi:hypothetical protein